MSILVDLQPSTKAGLKLSKTLFKAAIRSKATPPIVAVAALEILSAACEQTGTYLPQFLADIAAEFHQVMEAQKKAAHDARLAEMSIGDNTMSPQLETEETPIEPA